MLEELDLSRLSTVSLNKDTRTGLNQVPAILSDSFNLIQQADDLWSIDLNTKKRFRQQQRLHRLAKQNIKSESDTVV